MEEPFKPLPVPEEAPKLTKKVFGYYPYWVGGYSGFHWDLLSTVAYFSAEVDTAAGDGSISELHGWGTTTSALISTAHAMGVEVVLTVTCFDGPTITSVLSDAGNRTRLTNNLLTLVMDAGGDGVNIDFEGVPAGGTNKANLVNLMTELSTAFHSSIPGFQVTIATPAVDWSGVFDYDLLALNSDGLVIMGYDYHWSGGDPGPVSPLSGSSLWGPYSITWTVNDYLVWGGGENRGKFILGLPFYGYDWPSVDYTIPGEATGGGVGIRYTDAKGMAGTYGSNWDADSETPFVLYTDTGPHQLWYDDSESLSRKFDLVLAQDLGGIAIWALNYEGSETDVWDAVRDHFQDEPDPPWGTPASTIHAAPGSPSLLANHLLALVFPLVAVFAMRRLQRRNRRGKSRSRFISDCRSTSQETVFPLAVAVPAALQSIGQWPSIDWRYPL